MARLLGLALALSLCACASFRSHPLAELDPAQVIDKQHPLPAISFEARGWPCVSTELLFRSAFADARRGPAHDDLHVVLAFATQDELGSGVFWPGVVSLLTLTIVPFWVSFEHSLVVRVEGPGREAREYAYRESTTDWTWLLMLPLGWSHDPSEVRRAICENMLLHFLVELRRDLGSQP